MRLNQRNLQPLWYRLYESVAPDTFEDEYGNVLEIGEVAMSYGEPVEMNANIAPATGTAVVAGYGSEDEYDRVIATTWMDCPIDTNSVLYIDSEPVQNGTTGEWSAHDYVVNRVAKSINGIRIYAKKVDVS